MEYNKLKNLGTYAEIKAEVDVILFVIDNMYKMIFDNVPENSCYHLISNDGDYGGVGSSRHNFFVETSDGTLSIIGFDQVGYNNIFSPESTYWFNAKDDRVSIWRDNGEIECNTRLDYPLSTDLFNEEWYFQMSTIHDSWEIFNIVLCTYLRLYIFTIPDNISNITSISLNACFIDLMYDHLYNGTKLNSFDFLKKVKYHAD